MQFHKSDPPKWINTLKKRSEMPLSQFYLGQLHEIAFLIYTNTCIYQDLKLPLSWKSVLGDLFHEMASPKYGVFGSLVVRSVKGSSYRLLLTDWLFIYHYTNICSTWYLQLEYGLLHRTGDN